MRHYGFLVAAAGAALALSGCGGGAEKTLSEGQSIARVGDEDVTIHELNAELKGAPIPAGDQRKLIEQAALQQIVDRRILADIAREQKLDETPDYLLMKKRAEETVLVQLLQQKIAGTVKRPTREAAKTFITANPNLFDQHKIFVLDQITFQMPADPKKLVQLQPLKSLGDIEQWLNENGLQYRRLPSSLDSIQMPAEMTNKIMSLPAGEVFVVPTNGAVTASVITNTRIEPITGDKAIDVAMRMLQNKAMGEAAQKQLEGQLKERRAKVTYQKGYSAPPSAAPAAKPAAAAAKPAAG